MRLLTAHASCTASVPAAAPAARGLCSPQRTLVIVHVVLIFLKLVLSGTSVHHLGQDEVLVPPFAIHSGIDQQREHHLRRCGLRPALRLVWTASEPAPHLSPLLFEQGGHWLQASRSVRGSLPGTRLELHRLCLDARCAHRQTHQALPHARPFSGGVERLEHMLRRQRPGGGSDTLALARTLVQGMQESAMPMLPRGRN